MKISAQEIEQRQVVLEVEVEPERVERALDQAYKRIVNRINVPGFRRGRAPRPLVERMVGRAAILEDAVEKLVPEVYQDALQEQAITPAGQPSLEVTSTEPLHFKATVPLQPKTDLGDYRSIQIDLDAVAVEDSEVDAIIQNLRESHATWVPVERAVQLGDRVALDVKATRGERTIIDSRDAEFVVNPSGPEPAPGFSEQVLGMEPDQERSFSLGGGREAEGEEQRPTADFTVRLQGVKEKELPELDDEFARTAADKESLEQLLGEIREQIRNHKQQTARERQRNAIVQAAVDQARVEMPPQLVERQAGRRLETLAAGLDKQGISVEQYLQFTGKDEATFRSELLSDASDVLKRSLVLEAIAEAEGLEVSEAELGEEIERAAQGAGDPARTARQALARPETRATVESALKTQKGFQRLMELTGGAEAAPESAEEAPQTTGETNVEPS